EERVRRELQRQASGRASEPGMVPQPRRSEGADRTLAAVLQRAAAAQRTWLQTPGDRSPELVGTRYHSPRTHCLIGYKFHTQVRYAGEPWPTARRCRVPGRLSGEKWLRKLPRQAGISKVELPATRWRYSAGVRSPSESWGRSSLYSSIHQYAASRTSSRRVNRCWSRTSSRKVRLKRPM